MNHELPDATPTSWPRWLRCVGALVLLPVGTSACVTSFENNLSKHVICFDAGGYAVLPDGDGRRLRGTRKDGDDAEFLAYIEAVLVDADAECDARGPVRRLLVHVHGGLNTRAAALSTADRIISAMGGDGGEDWYYPIFVTWPSGAISTYGQYLGTFRQGQTWRFLGPVTSPAVLITDVARGVARAPQSLSYQFLDDVLFQSEALSGGDLLPPTKNVEALYTANAELEEPYRIIQGEYHRSVIRKVGQSLWYLVTLGSKIVTQITFVDGFGHGAWQVMRHRISNLFRHPEEFDVQDRRGDPEAVAGSLEEKLTGDLSFFLERLTDHINREKAKGARYEITLVAHSMGAIVLNEAFAHAVKARSVHAEPAASPGRHGQMRAQKAPEEPEVADSEDGSGGTGVRLVGLLPEDDIVRVIYMAPACSIRHTLDTVVPFLLAQGRATFHILTLNPIAEVLERNYAGFVPNGSLLMWVDNFYTSPAAHTDRRLGVWPNVIQAIHLFRPVRSVLTITAFGVGPDPGSMPRRHGEFNLCPFWRREFWDGTDARPYLWNAASGSWQRHGGSRE